MPTAGLLSLLDDIATMSKIAAKKTAAISGDDLAVNSKTVVGIDPKRELPIVYAVAKGSLKNKFLYLIPAAMGLSLAAPWAIMPLLTLGGAYLCYEAVEKIVHKEKHDEKAEKEPADPKAREQKIIKGAIRTDMILSAEIVVVTLGAVAASTLVTQLAVLAAVGVGMTVGIYGLVGGIVKLDDVGAWMAKRKGGNIFAKATRGVGRALVGAVPHMMKGISFLGTAAMFLVGGGLVMHGIPAAGAAIASFTHGLGGGALVHGAIETLADVAVGAGVGLVAIPVMKVVEKVTDAATKLGRKIYGATFGRKKRKSAPEAQAPKPAAAPPPPAQETTRAAAPDISAAHNAAAQKTAAPEKPPAPPPVPPRPETPPAPPA